MLVALRSSRTRTTVPSRIRRTTSSPARSRRHHASQSARTLRQVRLTTSLPTAPPNRPASARLSPAIPFAACSREPDTQSTFSCRDPYPSPTALHDVVRARADRATARTVETGTIRVEASRDAAERLAINVLGREAPVAPTNWSFGQMCSLVGAPASYLRQLPAPLAGINLQHALLSHRAELGRGNTLRTAGPQRLSGRNSQIRPCRRA